MEHPGKSSPAPDWYRERQPTFIEEKFAQATRDFADAIEKEKWFGDREHVSRYRVDFLLRDAGLIVELDGHETHSTPEQLQNDAQRQRYLTRCGYSVIRFTGREINANVSECAEELRSIYRERMQRALVKKRVLYIDYPFLEQQCHKTMGKLSSIHADKTFPFPNPMEVIRSAIEGLHERSFVTVFIFGDEDHAQDLKDLNGKVFEYQKGEIRINTVFDAVYSAGLCEHLIAYTDLYDEFFLIGDDPMYEISLSELAPPANTKLIRMNSWTTNYSDPGLNHVRWQDIHYIIASTYGLDISEM